MSAPQNSIATTSIRPTNTGASNAKHFQVTNVAPHSAKYVASDSHVVVLQVGDEFRTYTSDGAPLATLVAAKDVIRLPVISDTTRLNMVGTVLVTTSSDGVTAVHTTQSVNLPARGVEPARIEYFVIGWNAANGQRLWQAKLPNSESIMGSSSLAVSATVDGKWLTVGSTYQAYRILIDAKNGSVKQVDFAPYPIGPYIARSDDHECAFCGASQGALINPTTFEVVTGYVTSKGPFESAIDLARGVDAVLFANGTRIAAANHSGLYIGN
ncbi:hypothetical protein, partial [Nocardia salmonicida]